MKCKNFGGNVDCEGICEEWRMNGSLFYKTANQTARKSHFYW